MAASEESWLFFPETSGQPEIEAETEAAGEEGQDEAAPASGQSLGKRAVRVAEEEVDESSSEDDLPAAPRRRRLNKRARLAAPAPAPTPALAPAPTPGPAPAPIFAPALTSGQIQAATAATTTSSASAAVSSTPTTSTSTNSNKKTPSATPGAIDSRRRIVGQREKAARLNQLVGDEIMGEFAGEQGTTPATRTYMGAIRALELEREKNDRLQERLKRILDLNMDEDFGFEDRLERILTVSMEDL